MWWYQWSSYIIFTIIYHLAAIFVNDYIKIKSMALPIILLMDMLVVCQYQTQILSCWQNTIAFNFMVKSRVYKNPTIMTASRPLYTHIKNNSLHQQVLVSALNTTPYDCSSQYLNCLVLLLAHVTHTLLQSTVVPTILF